MESACGRIHCYLFYQFKLIQLWTCLEHTSIILFIIKQVLQPAPAVISPAARDTQTPSSLVIQRQEDQEGQRWIPLTG